MKLHPLPHTDAYDDVIIMLRSVALLLFPILPIRRNSRGRDRAVLRDAGLTISKMNGYRSTWDLNDFGSQSRLLCPACSVKTELVNVFEKLISFSIIYILINFTASAINNA